MSMRSWTRAAARTATCARWRPRRATSASGDRASTSTSSRPAAALTRAGARPPWPARAVRVRGLPWEEGERRLREVPAERRPALERVAERLVAELRRRLGCRSPRASSPSSTSTARTGAWTSRWRTRPEDPFAWETRRRRRRGLQPLPARGLRLRRRPPPRSSRAAGAARPRSGPRRRSPTRRITIWSSSTVTATGRWPAQCSA